MRRTFHWSNDNTKEYINITKICIHIFTSKEPKIISYLVNLMKEKDIRLKMRTGTGIRATNYRECIKAA